MNDLRELYQSLIVDHSRHPRHFGLCTPLTCSQEAENPLCGDRLLLGLQIEGDVIQQIKFTGEGCAISVASASLMTELITGKTLAEVQALFCAFQKLLVGEQDTSESTSQLGKICVLAGVRAFPMRVKCATLAWHTLRAALDTNSSGPSIVSTE